MTSNNALHADNSPTGARYEDEISLLDLFMILWRNRIVSVVVAAAILVLTLAYLFLAQPVYKAETQLLPPQPRDVQPLNVAQQLGLLGYGPGDVYGEFIRQLNSLDLRYRFFRENNLLDYYVEGEKGVLENTVFHEMFSEKLVVHYPRKDSNDYFHRVTFEIDDDEKSAELLNRFIEMAVTMARDNLIGNVKNSMAAEIQRLESDLASKKNVIKQRREDLVAQMEEALLIARRLKINRPADYTREYERYTQNESVAVNVMERPLYIRGILALEAEIETLKNRKSDEPYISGLRDVEERLDAIRALAFDPQSIRVVTIDMPALIPEKPLRPKKLLVLVIGMLMAGFLGIAAAFIAEFIKGLRRWFELLHAEQK